MRNWRASAAGKETSGTRFLEQQGSWCDRGRARGQRSGGDRREKGLKRGRGQAQELCDLDKEFGFKKTLQAPAPEEPAHTLGDHYPLESAMMPSQE